MNPVFRHAVASFEPTESSVLLWTRVTGGDATARWTVSADPDGLDVVVAGEATPDPGADHTIVVDVDDLRPATSYWYWFECGGQRSPVGRTRTLPAAPASELRLGLVCCARFSMAPLGVYRAMAEREVDVVVHLGDYIYEDDGAKGPRQHRPPHTATTLDDYRTRLAQVREDPDCQALHLRHPMIVAIDDHDVADNCWRDGAKAHDPAEHGPWRARARAATQARQEWLPARLRDPDDPTATWRSVTIADLAELVILDTRLSGRDLQAGEEEGPDLHDPQRSLLGDDQRQWLEQRLADHHRPWALLASPVVVNEITLDVPGSSVANRLLPDGYAALDGRLMHDDQWDGYPAERSRLTAWMAERGRAGRRTVILSGDVHSSWAFLGPRDDDGEPVAVEFTTPAVSSSPMGHSRVPGAWRFVDRLIRQLEHVPWVDVTERGYGLCTVTPDQVAMEWWFVDATDPDPSAGARLGRAYESDRSWWPPRLTEGDARPDPERPGPPAPLPGRPDDLRALRRAHRRRRLATGAAVSTVVIGLGALAVLRLQPR